MVIYHSPIISCINLPEDNLQQGNKQTGTQPTKNVHKRSSQEERESLSQRRREVKSQENFSFPLKIFPPTEARTEIFQNFRTENVFLEEDNLHLYTKYCIVLYCRDNADPSIPGGYTPRKRSHCTLFPVLHN